MDFIKRVQRRLPDPVFFSKLNEKRESFNISDIDLKKAQSDNIECLFEIANKCYLYNWYEGVLVTAYKLSKKNHRESQRMIGELFKRGYLGFKNKSYAFQWYKTAAENGSITALEYLREGLTGCRKCRICHIRSIGDTRSHRIQMTKATKIRKLEMKGYPQATVLWNSEEAQFKLETFFENGIGVDVDKEFAKIWYLKSALQGYKPAIEKSKELEKEGYAFILISPGTIPDTVVVPTVVNEQSTNKYGENRNEIEVHRETDLTDNGKMKQISMQEYQTLLDKLEQIERKMSSFNLYQNESNNDSGSEAYFDAKDNLLQERDKETEQIGSLLVNSVS